MERHSRANILNLTILVGIGLVMVLGCLSEESKRATEEWRAKELKAQETRADLAKRGDEFAKMTAPVKLAKEPYLKGKVVIVYTWADGKNEIQENDIQRKLYHAQSVTDYQSVFKVKCSEIPAGTYVFESKGKEVPAFTVRCDSEIIDKTIPAVVFKKTFENTKLPETVKEGRFTGIPDKVVSDLPTREIDDFLYELGKKQEAAEQK